MAEPIAPGRKIEGFTWTVEDVNLISSGEVWGDVRCVSHLSGMPDLRLRFNRPSLLEDVSLHRCVRGS